MASIRAWIPWTEAVDSNTGRKYWWHKETRETTWKNPIPDTIIQKAKQLFKQFDRDGGGSISTEELAGALAELEISVTQQQLNMLVLRFDEDKSGELDCEEWIHLVQDAVSASEGNPDLKSLMQFYARRMPLKDVKRAKGYPDPPSKVCASGDEDGCAVWWTPPPERVNTKPPIGYIIKRYRREEGGSWRLKGETEFLSAACSQRITGMKPKIPYRFSVTCINEHGRSVDSDVSNAVRREAKLPQPWVEYFDEATGRYYYYNKVSMVRSWVRPDQDPLYVDTNLFIQFSPAEMENLKRVYVDVDYDYSGAINREELESVLPKLGERLLKNDIDYLYFHCDEDQSGELDFQEFVAMILRLKQERMKKKSFNERMKEKKEALKDWNTRPKIGDEVLDKFIPEPKKKMGPWNKIFHPTVGRCYFHNTETGVVEWEMPEEVKFFLSQELYDSLMDTFDPADIHNFEEKFRTIDIDNSGCIDEWEFKQLLHSMGERVSDQRVRALMAEVDKDGSGEMDFDEFCLMMQAFRNKGGTLGRLASKIDKQDANALQKVRERIEKIKKAAQKLRARFKRPKKFPHGKYCVCGCRAYPPGPEPKTWAYYFCCFGCIVCRAIFCNWCYKFFYCFCFICEAFKPPKPMFDTVPEVDLMRRKALIERNNAREMERQEREATKRGTDEFGQILSPDKAQSSV